MQFLRRGYAIAAGGLLCILWVVCAELFLRYQYSKDQQQLVQKYHPHALCTARAADSRLVYTYRPNSCGYNSHGYRDEEHAYEKNPNTYRIIIIGDSVAEGASVAQNFGKLLENKFNASLKKSGRYEMVILARSGYSTSQELVLFEEEAFQYYPDLIIWSYVLNDPAHPVRPSKNGQTGSIFLPRMWTSSPHSRSGLGPHSLSWCIAT